MWIQFLKQGKGMRRPGSQRAKARSEDALSWRPAGRETVTTPRALAGT